MFFPQTAAVAEGRRTFRSCLKHLPSFLFGEKKGPYVFFFFTVTNPRLLRMENDLMKNETISKVTVD